MNSNEQNFTIQHVAEVTGLSVYTLRYYERIGLIHHIDRIENTHRRYSQDDIGWIEFLNKLRTTGMTIQQMKAYADLQRLGDISLPERLELLKMHRDEVERHMRELHEYMEVICYKIDFYQGVVDEQKLLTP